MSECSVFACSLSRMSYVAFGFFPFYTLLIYQIKLLSSGLPETSFHRLTGSVASGPDPEPYPYIPLLAPPPSVPSINSSVPELSGKCYCTPF